MKYIVGIIVLLLVLTGGTASAAPPEDDKCYYPTPESEHMVCIFVVEEEAPPTFSIDGPATVDPNAFAERLDTPEPYFPPENSDEMVVDVGVPAASVEQQMLPETGAAFWIVFTVFGGVSFALGTTLRRWAEKKDR